MNPTFNVCSFDYGSRATAFNGLSASNVPGRNTRMTSCLTFLPRKQRPVVGTE
jgi:hypothetical protein